MARSKDFMDGWSMGWTAATEALLQSWDHLMARAASAIETVQPAMAANKPAPRRRGRPPKSSLLSAEPPRRRRGRPPKSSQSPTQQPRRRRGRPRKAA